MSEIVRFVLEDTSVVSFYDHGNEIEITSMKHYPRVRTVDLSIDQFGKARLFTPGLKSYQVWAITFRRTAAYGEQVMDKLETLYDEVDSYFNPKQLLIYPNYHTAPSTYYYVHMKREQFVREYAMGDILGGELTIEFVECNENVDASAIAGNNSWIFRPIAVNLS